MGLIQTNFEIKNIKKVRHIVLKHATLSARSIALHIKLCNLTDSEFETINNIKPNIPKRNNYFILQKYKVLLFLQQIKVDSGWKYYNELEKIINLYNIKKCNLCSKQLEKFQLLCTKCRIETQRFYDYNINIFLNETDVSYYLLGVFITDGTMSRKSNSFSMSSKDYNWIVSISKLICPIKKILHIDNYYAARFHNKQMYNWLLSKECIPKKSLVVKLPAIPNEYLFDFIRGVIDGDGSIGIYPIIRNEKDTGLIARSCRISSGSFEFVRSIQLVLEGNGIKSSISKRKLKGTGQIEGRTIKSNNWHYSLNLSALNSYKLLSKCYYPENCLCLDRKYILARQIVDYYDNKFKI